MRFIKSCLSGVLLLATGCGGDVGNDAANTAGGGTAIGGAEPAGGAGGVGAESATGATGASYSGGMVELTTDQYQLILNSSCVGFTASPSACTIVLPKPTSGQIDPTNVSVIYEVNGQGNIEELIGLSNAACSQGDGWYLDTNGNITLCAKTCITIHYDSNLTIRVIFRCSPGGGLIQ